VIIIKNIASRILIFSLLFLLFGYNGICSSDIKFEMVNGLMIIEAEIDGERGDYIFDTGADAVILNKQKKNGIPISFNSLSGNLDAYETKIKKIYFGDLVMEKIVGFISDLSSLESYTNRKINGILGSGILHSHLIEIDYCKKSILIHDDYSDKKHSSYRRSLPFKMDAGVPIAKIIIENRAYNFILDSGASAHFVTQRVIDENSDKFFGTGEMVMIATAGKDQVTSNKYFLRSMILEKGEVNNLKFCVFDNSSYNTQNDYDGIISFSQLGVSRILIDLKNNNVQF
jgi:hypothetical protein